MVNDSYNYFVAALPRSRTAWLSTFLSQSGIHCFHDGMNGCSSFDDYTDKVYGCGDSSTGLHLFEIEKIYPNAPIVIIEKNEEEVLSCIEWCDSVYGGSNKAEIMRQKKLLDGMSGMRVKQSDIDAKLKPIFEYLTGKEYLDIYSDIKSLNIQCMSTDIDADAAKELMREAI